MTQIDDDLLHFYSEHLFSYIKLFETKIKTIITNEMHLKVGRSRFHVANYSFPIKIVLFEHPQKLGYFCPNTYTIGVHKQFTLSNNEAETNNLLRHELAHYYQHITNPQNTEVHGVEYRSICKKFGWSKEVYNSSSLPTPKRVKALAMHNKIQKLMSLSESSNVNEANAALEKARLLLEKYQINMPSNETYMVCKKILWQKRVTPLLDAIGSILEEFFVVPILSRSKDSIYLEIFGNKAHVEVGQYIAIVLQKKLPELYKASNCKGHASMKSFYLGLVDGFKANITKAHSQNEGLLIYNKQLQDLFGKAFPKLKQTTKTFMLDSKASSRGFRAGKSLDIKRGIKATSITHLEVK